MAVNKYIINIILNAASNIYLVDRFYIHLWTQTKINHEQSICNLPGVRRKDK